MSKRLKHLLLFVTLALIVFPLAGTAFAQVEHTHLHVDIDIKPGSYPNSINLNNKGLIPVALFGSEAFQISQVNIGTVRLGPMGNMDVGAPAVMARAEDVNLDGYPDLVFFFKASQTGLQPEDTTACLHGALLDGIHFCGHDDVKVIG